MLFYNVAYRTVPYRTGTGTGISTANCHYSITFL